MKNENRSREEYFRMRKEAKSHVTDLACSRLWRFPKDPEVVGVESAHPQPGKPNIWLGVYWNGWEAWNPKAKKLWWAQIYFGLTTWDLEFADKNSWHSKNYETAEECLKEAEARLTLVIQKYMRAHKEDWPAMRTDPA